MKKSRSRCSSTTMSKLWHGPYFLAACSECEETARGVVIAVEAPACVGEQRTEPGSGERFVRAQCPAVSGGQRGPPRGMKDRQPRAGTADSSEFSEPGFDVWQMVHQACGEHRVDDASRHRQMAGVGEDERRVLGPTV